MTDHLFITGTGQIQPNWADVFPDAKARQSFSRLRLSESPQVFWVEWPANIDERHYYELESLVRSGKPVVVLSPVPNQAQAQTAISLGAKGYCHSFAVSKQLKEVAVVVTNGGLWLGPDLMQKVLAGSLTAGVRLPPASSFGKSIDQLTKRERVVAQSVAGGLTNREISEKLNIGERTVKSHLTIIFQKLQVRDRVQLALLLNDIDISDS